MTKAAESHTNFIAGSHTNLINEESCNKGCCHCRAHTHKLRIGPTEVEINTGLFACHNPKSDHYDHVFTSGHRMCEEWD